MRKKEILSRIMRSCVPVTYLSKTIGRSNKKLLILAYHRVLNVIDNEFPYDEELISATIEQFDAQIRYLSNNYNPINEQQLIKHVYDGEDLPDYSVMITFDDGYDDNFNFAYPILKKYSVPAMIFVSTGYINSDETFWYDWLSLLLNGSDSKEIFVPGLDKIFYIDNKQLNKKHLVEILVYLRSIPNNERVSVVESLKSEYSDSIINTSSSLSKPMTWDDIRNMDRDLITIGSHTVTHPIMSMLSEEELEFELLMSKKKIENELNVDVNSIAYPVGMRESINDKVVNQTKMSGYKLGFTYINGINSVPVINKFMLERLHVEKDIDDDYFKSIINFPNLFKD